MLLLSFSEDMLLRDHTEPALMTSDRHHLHIIGRYGQCQLNLITKVKIKVTKIVSVLPIFYIIPNFNSFDNGVVTVIILVTI